jgi:hypothetical protein
MVAKNHATFGFHFGTSLANPEAWLEGAGKNIRYVKLRGVDDLGAQRIGGHGGAGAFTVSTAWLALAGLNHLG